MQSLMGSDSSKLALLKEQNNMLDMISLRFDENKAYETGDYCLYFNGVFDGLYRFKLPKVAGVWDGSAVESVSLSGVLNELSTKVNSNSTLLDQMKSKLFAVASGSITSGMPSGIYYGQFDNGPTTDDVTNSPFDAVIYLVGTWGTNTSVYAFTINQYANGHIFFNRMQYGNVFDYVTWKKLL